MGANGISAKAGFTTPDAEEGMLKSEAFGRSYMAYVLADHTKFDWVSPVSFAPIDKACIITDHLPDESYRSFTIIEEVSHI